MWYGLCEAVCWMNAGSAGDAALRAVGDWLPLTHAYDLLTFLWLGGTWDVETTIGTPIWVSFAYLGAIAAVCVAGSARMFRWD